MATPDNKTGLIDQSKQAVGPLSLIDVESDKVSYDFLSPENNKIFDNAFLQKDFVSGIPKNYVKIVCKVFVTLEKPAANPFFTPGVGFQIVLIKNGKEKIIDVENNIIIISSSLL